MTGHMYIWKWKLKYLCDVLLLYSSYIHAKVIHCLKIRTMNVSFRKGKKPQSITPFIFFKSILHALFFMEVVLG